MTPAGIEFVAQHPNHCVTAVLLCELIVNIYLHLYVRCNCH